MYSEKSCPGLLVFVLKVFEELNLNVLEARVSCTGSFQLEALGVEVIIVPIENQTFNFRFLKLIKTTPFSWFN